MQIIAVGEMLRGKRIKEVVQLSNGCYVVKTENGKSVRDFKVRTIFQVTPRIRSLTPKHAHFVIDFYGKLCASREKGMRVLDAIVETWSRKPVQEVFNKYQGFVSGLPGYDLQYILHALNWILDQEDVNFNGRPVKKQQEIDSTLRKSNITSPPGREGSQLAVSLFGNLTLGIHPVEAFRSANLDVIPVKRSRGAV